MLKAEMLLVMGKDMAGEVPDKQEALAVEVVEADVVFHLYHILCLTAHPVKMCITDGKVVLF